MVIVDYGVTYFYFVSLFYTRKEHPLKGVLFMFTVRMAHHGQQWASRYCTPTEKPFHHDGNVFHTRTALEPAHTNQLHRALRALRALTPARLMI